MFSQIPDCLKILKSSDFEASTGNKFFYKNCAGEKIAVDVTHTDNIWLKFNDKIKIQNLFILTSFDEKDEKYKPLAYGKFREINNKYFLELTSKNIHIDFNSNNIAYKIIFLEDDGERCAANFEAISEELPNDDEHVLCVDFGTSNTSVGTWDEFGHGFNLVAFDDILDSDKIRYSNLLPTVAYIQHADIDNNKYKMLFGYEALKYLKYKDYRTEGSFFLNIKQWLSANLDYKIDCKDEDDNYFKIYAKDIISNYLKYVVNLSEIKLKKHYIKLHFSAPVKLKSKFNDLVKEIFNKDNGYEVISANESLDEGLAIIYNYISKQRDIFEKSSTKENKGKVMVIDCGGGTTDIARCEYEFEEADTGIKAKIKTKFENGFNFGGNKLTYLIFQLLKIKLSEFYKEPNNESNSIKFSIGDYLNKNVDYLKYIDECVKNERDFEFYKDLDEASKKAEWVLPTDFGNRKIVDG